MMAMTQTERVRFVPWTDDRREDAFVRQIVVGRADEFAPWANDRVDDRTNDRREDGLYRG
jgi:hypothetical protein